MKTLGVIGGIGPESTIDYYRLLVTTYRERVTDRSYTKIIINSINLRRMVDLVESGDLASLVDFLLGEIEKLQCAGADFGLIASNTPHMVFDELSRRSPLPLVSIVEATCEEAAASGLTRLGLFGSRFTMQGRFYSDVFSKRGITVIMPAMP